MKTIKEYSDKQHNILVEEYYRKNFDSFYNEMIGTMVYNHNEKRDSFISIDIPYLINMLLDYANCISTSKMNDKPYNKRDFINLANFCAMAFGRHEIGIGFIEEKDYVNRLINKYEG